VDVATPDGEAIQGKHGDEFDAEATRMAARRRERTVVFHHGAGAIDNRRGIGRPGL